MKNSFKTIITMALILSATLTYASETSSSDVVSLTIVDAVDLALSNNISIKRNEITLKAKERLKDTSWNSISPSLSATASYSKNNEHFDDNYTVSVGGKINFTLSANLYSDIKSAILDYEAGQLSYETASRTIEHSVRKSFYNLLYAEEAVKLKEANLQTAKNQWDANKTKYEKGFISQLDVLTSQVNYEKLKPTLDSEKANYENALAEFKHVLGIDQDKEIKLSGNFNAITNLTEISLDGVEPEFPALKTLEKNLEVAEANLLAKRFTAYGPTISAGWSYTPGSSKSYNQDATEWKDKGSLSLSVTLPLDGLLPWSKSQNNISAAKDTIKDYELQIEDQKISSQITVDTDMKNIRKSIETIKALKSNIDLAEKTYQMTLDAYNKGSRDLLTLQSAQNSLESARLDIKSEAYSLICTILDLEDTLGVPFGTLTKLGE